MLQFNLSENFSISPNICRTSTKLPASEWSDLPLQWMDSNRPKCVDIFFTLTGTVIRLKCSLRLIDWQSTVNDDANGQCPNITKLVATTARSFFRVNFSTARSDDAWIRNLLFIFSFAFAVSTAAATWNIPIFIGVQRNAHAQPTDDRQTRGEHRERERKIPTMMRWWWWWLARQEFQPESTSNNFRLFSTPYTAYGWALCAYSDSLASTFC